MCNSPLISLKVVCNTLQKYLKANLGHHLSTEGANAWRKLLKTLVDVVVAEQSNIRAEDLEWDN